MLRRTLTPLALLGILGFAAFGIPTSSGATFSSTSVNAISTVTAAADWTPPSVSVQSPGSSVKDTVTLTATATDDQSGIASVTVQYRAPGASTWTALCTKTSAPYSCSWNTKDGADGTYGLRGIATDNAGYVTTSEVISTTVANNLLVVLSDPGDVVKGNVPLTATLYNAGLVPYVVTIQYAVNGSTTWKNLCTVLVSPYTCTWTTTGGGFAQGETYDLRATATSGLTVTTSALVNDVLIDNVAPTVSMTDPGTPLRGTATFAAVAADADSGVASVALQYQRSGTATWATFCTLTVEPFSCRYNTTQLTDGTYAFRAIATDAIGNAATSAVVGNRVVDNTVSTVSVEDPGDFLNGTVTLTASAASTAGIASVRIDRAPSGSSTWTTICTDTTAPYTCSWNTTTVADGLYDLRAVMTDTLARVTTSATLSARRVDNSPLRAYDVQTINGGAKEGRLENGDVLKLTYTDQVNLSTVTSGWTGTSLAVTLRLRDARILGNSGNNDAVDILRSGTAVNLGSINLKQNFIKNNKEAAFNATMVASTVTVNGNPATLITITLGTLSSGGSLRTAGGPAAMVWTPSALVTDPYGQACSLAPGAELGVSDKDF